MKNLLAASVLALMASGPLQAAVVAILQEAENDTVEFSIQITNPVGFDYSGFSANHLQYIFFDDVGDYIDGAALGSNSPQIFEPVSHGLAGTSADGFTIGIQALALDNDGGPSNNNDDFVLRFIGQTPGLTNGVTPLNFDNFLNYDPVRIRNLSFSVLNEGIYSSNNAQANALGGFTLRVNALPPVPLPAAVWSFLTAIGAVFLVGRGKRRRTGIA